MTEIASTTFSQVDGSNTGALPGITGSSSPALIDNSIQALMGAIKREHDWRNFTITSSGSANAYVLTYSVAPAAYYTGQAFGFKTNFAVTGAATVNVNTLGAKTIKKLVSGTKTDLASGDIASGDYVSIVYDGTDFVWVNKGTASAPSGSITSSGYTQSTARMLGRSTASTGAIEEISVGAGLALSAGSIATSGAITSSGFTQSTSRLLGRTTASTGAVEEISVGTGLTLSGGSLTATGGGVTSLGTITTTSGASQSLGSLNLTNYKFVELWCNGVSASATGGFLIGNSTADDVTMIPSIGAGASFTGVIRIDLSTGVYVTTGYDGTNGITRSEATSPITTASTAISIAPNTGTLDAGSIKVYGVS